jgi:hypothetical protein
VRQAQDLERQILTDWLRQLIGVTLLELRGNAVGDKRANVLSVHHDFMAAPFLPGPAI